MVMPTDIEAREYYKFDYYDDKVVVKTVIANSDTQHPIPTNGDSVYAKDVWCEESDFTGWEDTDSTNDEVCVIPFNNLHTHITNSSSDNPKVFTVHFKRTINAHQVGLGCYDGVDSFSNVKIELLGSSGSVRHTLDDSSNNTKYNSKNYEFEPQLFNAIKVYFYTSDEVYLSNITIQKSIETASFIKIQRPDDTVVNAQGTNQGNFKISLEEYDGTFDTKPLPVRNFTQIGTEGNVWDNESTGVDTPSNIVDTENYPHISIIGTADGVTTFSVYVSVDGVNFYLCEDLSTKVNAPEGYSFHVYFIAGVRYFRLESSSDVTATVTICAKP